MKNRTRNEPPPRYDKIVIIFFHIHPFIKYLVLSNFFEERAIKIAPTFFHKLLYTINIFVLSNFFEEWAIKIVLFP